MNNLDIRATVTQTMAKAKHCELQIGLGKFYLTYLGGTKDTLEGQRTSTKGTRETKIHKDSQKKEDRGEDDDVFPQRENQIPNANSQLH